ncbi:hypothetical protein GGR54DRAFT_590007 [Hypoxylon sp. NC1633]|nr:hypothetical protein GGR54DRAFT_590007 [Hypoxylon sp. NC1633]
MLSLRKLPCPSSTPLLLCRRMASNQSNRAVNGHTLTSLSRWSILDKKLPPVDAIRAIHIYDFDNTLFQTPLPNPKLWHSTTIGQLCQPDVFINGGWWHNPRILAATGEGEESEEKRAWDGWWNEKIVELVRLSNKQNDALCVLLTGRSEHGFSSLIKRIVTSKGLDFHMIALKPSVGPNNERFSTTMEAKQIFIREILRTYKEAKEIRIYEDREKHIADFREFLSEYNLQQAGFGQGLIEAEVIPVAEISTSLDPVVEVSEVQHLINDHNALITDRDSQKKRLSIKKAVFFTSYMLEPADTKQLITVLTSLVPEVDDLKYLANSVLITPRLCPKHILERIGGMNSRMKWQLADIGSYHNNLWAARLRPVPANAVYHTDNLSPSVVLGLRRGTRPSDVNKIQNWKPVPPEKSFIFETTVGEKCLLRLEREDQEGDQYSDADRLQYKKRKFVNDDDRQSRQHSGNYGNGNGNSRNYHTSNYQGRGGGENRGRGGFRGSGNSRGNRGGGGGRGNSRGSNRGGKGGGAHGYRSLDDVSSRDNSQGGFGSSTVSYDDSFPTLPQGGPPPQKYPPPPPPSYGQPFPQHSHWQPSTQGSGAPPQGRPMGAPGPDLQSFY